MRGTIKEVMTAIFGIAILVIILEHAGGFSKVVGSSVSGTDQVFNTLVGHGKANH